MSSSVKLAAVFSAALLASAFAAEKNRDDKSQKSSSKEGAEQREEKEKKTGSADAESPKAIEVPMPSGREAKGLKIPYRDEEGRLLMRFDIGVATRINENHIQMSQLQVETFDASGASEMVMDLPTSVLDLTTSVITAQEPVTIKRADFELTGENMTFNTKTKQGALSGKVRMLIYNLENETAPASASPQAPTK